MAELDAEDRQRIPKTEYAYVDARGEKHLPINDESHIRNAMARYNQTEFEDEAAKDEARKKILAAARGHGIDVNPQDQIAKPVNSLRAASTKAGPRGGQKEH